MDTFIEIEVHSTRETIVSSHNIQSFEKCFFIDFEFSHTTLPFQSDATTLMSDFTTTIKQVVKIPIEILCTCLEGDNKGILYARFSFVPAYLLCEILPTLEEVAREMVANNYEKRDILEMNVRLSAITSIEQCPICLEEFCIKSELWIQQCINGSSTYTCPLCRGLL